MRIPIVTLAFMVLAGTAAAQVEGSAIEFDLPTGAVLVVFPEDPGRLYVDGTLVAQPLAVRVGWAQIDFMGMCFLDEPMPGVTELAVAVWDAVPPTLNLVPGLLPLEAPTDAGGWSDLRLGGLRGGGYSDGPVPLVAYVPDLAVCAWGYEFDVELRSPDINGDLIIDLSDIVLFTQAYGGPYQARADFTADGVINLADIVVFSQALF